MFSFKNVESKIPNLRVATFDSISPIKNSPQNAAQHAHTSPYTKNKPTLKQIIHFDIDAAKNSPEAAQETKDKTNFSPDRPQTIQRLKPIPPKLNLCENLLVSDRSDYTKKHRDNNQSQSPYSVKASTELPKKAVLPNILKVGNKLILRAENSIYTDNENISFKINGKIQQTFQKKEIGSMQYIASPRLYYEEKLKKEEEPLAQRIKSFSGSLKSNGQSPLNCSDKLLPGVSSSIFKDDVRSRNGNSYSVANKSSKLQKDMIKIKVPEFELTKVKQFATPANLNSDRYVYKKVLVDPENIFYSSRNDQSSCSNRDNRTVAKGVAISKTELSNEHREKLRRMFQQENNNDFADGKIADSLPPLIEKKSNQIENSEKLGNNNLLKSDLKDAIAEYEKNFNDKFNKIVKRNSFKFGEIKETESKQPSETEKKWSHVVPQRKPFALVTPDDSFDEEMDIQKYKKTLVNNPSSPPKQKRADKKVILSSNIVEKTEEKDQTGELDKAIKRRRIAMALRERLLKYANLKVDLKQVRLLWLIKSQRP